MKDVDYIYGMNYIEQFRSELCEGVNQPERVAYVVNISRAIRLANGPFSFVYPWCYTRQGFRVWMQRANRWQRKELELYES